MSGFKTYLFMALAAIVNLLFGAEIIGAKLYAVLMGLLGSGGVAALRAGIACAEKKAEIAATAASEAASLASRTK